MIHIPEVTLFGIDCAHPDLLVEAFTYSCRFTRFAEIVLLTDLNKFPQYQKEKDPVIQFGLTRLPIRAVHHTESDRKVPCPRKEHYPLPIDYEMASLREPSEHVHTSHLLYMEWDSAVLNPWAWWPEWLDLDFVGASWPEHQEDGWPPCDGDTNAVGNFGFSLRSKKFCELTRTATEIFEGDPSMISCDMWACRVIRPWLEERGIKFATPEQSASFSTENRIYNSSFGFHGAHTAFMNGWSSAFFDRIKERVSKYK